MHYLVTKAVYHNISQILMVTEIQQIRSNQLMLKISTVLKLGQIVKIVSFSERGSLTENNGNITNV